MPSLTTLKFQKSVKNAPVKLCIEENLILVKRPISESVTAADGTS